MRDVLPVTTEAPPERAAKFGIFSSSGKRPATSMPRSALSAGEWLHCRMNDGWRTSCALVASLAALWADLPRRQSFAVWWSGADSRFPIGLKASTFCANAVAKREDNRSSLSGHCMIDIGEGAAMSRRRAFVGLASVITAALLGATAASAQEYPSQPIRIIVPTPAGGVADLAARVLAQRLSDMGKTAVVENRTGGGGSIAADSVAKSAADGYTIYVGFHATQAILPHLQQLPYDPDKDFAPVTIAVKSANILVVHPGVPAQSFRELIVYAKANPGKLTYASQGNGSSGHIVAEQLKQIADIDVVHVPYRGAAPAVAGFIGGLSFRRLRYSYARLAEFESGEGACASRSRRCSATRLFPGVPTTTEVGFPQLEGGPGLRFFVPQRRRGRSSTGCMRRRSAPLRRRRTENDLPAREAQTTPSGSLEETAAFVVRRN